MILPNYLVLEAPEQIRLLDATLHRRGYHDYFLEKLLKNTVNALKNRSDAPLVLEEYIEKVKYEEYVLGEIIALHLDKIGTQVYHALLDWGLYPPSGKLPYSYHDWDNVLILSFDGW
jgi:hypothetical protein